MSAPARRALQTRAPVLLAVILLVFLVVAGTAMLRTSVTFDEIIFPAAGARGYATGDFGMVRDHPPVMQYAYGLPLRMLDLNYPPEAGRSWNQRARYEYARALLWGSGNYPEKIILAARLASLLLGALLVFSCYMLTRRVIGPGGALLAAALVALMPDVLAHAGITYNDLPLALAVFLAVHGLDAAVRDPSPRRVALAAFATAIAIGVKTSGMVVIPVLVVLVALEAHAGRASDAAWRRGILRAIPIFAGLVYFTLVAIHLGDFRLEAFLDGLRANVTLNEARRPALLLGEISRTGFWYFFPAAFLLKTPVALHGLLLLALAAGFLAWRGRARRELFLHPLRGVAVAALLITAALMASKVNIGFRHALPVVPFACVLIAAGVSWFWGAGKPAVRVAVVALLASNAVSVAGYYPYFLPYISEYARHRPLYETLVDSNTDWGQGLIALHDFMQQRGIRQVYLGYFGSALPEGYRIDYVTLPSFFELPQRKADPQSLPRYIAVSATLLAGLYVKDDPFAELRKRQPVAILARTMWIYELP